MIFAHSAQVVRPQFAISEWGLSQTSVGGSITMSVASPSITVLANSLQVVLFGESCLNFSGGSSTPVLAVTDNIGDTGGGAWTQRALCTRGLVLYGEYAKSVSIWTRKIGTAPGVSKTITASLTMSYNGMTTSPDGWVWADFLQTSVQADSPIGLSTGSTTIQAPGPTTYTCTLGGTPAAPSVVYSLLAGDDIDRVANQPSGWTTLRENHDFAWGGAFESAYKLQSSVASPQWTNLATGASYLGAALEIKAF